VNPECIEVIANDPLPSVQVRAEAYLGAAIEKIGGKLSGSFDPASILMRVASWSETPEDALALAEYLAELGAIHRPELTGPARWRLLAKGYLVYEQITGRLRGGTQGFVAMWFDPQLRPAYEQGFAVAISNSGFSPLRVDMAEHAGKIDDRIIAEIRRSAFVVADFTGHRSRALTQLFRRRIVDQIW
jgi:hypothetical protein